MRSAKLSSCHAAESVAIIKKAHYCATDIWLLVWSEIAAWNGVDATADAVHRRLLLHKSSIAPVLGSREQNTVAITNLVMLVYL